MVFNPSFVPATIAAMIAVALATGASAQSNIADTVYTNGRIYTVDEKQPWADAVAIKDGKFVKVGTNAEIRDLVGTSTKVVDLGGRMALPGLIDHHAHPSIDGYMRSKCELPGSFVNPKFEDILAAIKACRDKLDGGAKWFISSGHSAAVWPKDKYNKEFLDEIFGDMPAYMEDETAHNALVNSAALKMAGVGKQTPDPEGGIIERRSDGEATGHMIEFGALDLIKPHLPKKDLNAQVAGLQWAVQLFNSYGFTAYGDAQIFEADLPIFEKAIQDGGLTAHGTLFVQALGNAGSSSIVAASKIKEMFERHNLPGMRLGAKVFVDGSIEGTTAALLEPYVGTGDGSKDLGVPRIDGPDAVAESVETGKTGDLTIPLKDLQAVFADLDEKDIQIKVHAIGDRGVRTTLDIFEVLISKRGGNQLTHHIDHLNMIHPADVPRFAKLGIPAGPYPSVAQLNSYQVGLIKPMLGESRFLQRTLPIGSLMRSGAIVAFKSDWASIPVWPFYGMQVAVTRTPPSDPAKEPLNKSEVIKLEDAIRGYTINGAIILNRDKEIGSIEAGKWADMIVIDRNLFETPVAEIHKAQVELTVFKGDPVYKGKKKKASVDLPSMRQYLRFAALAHGCRGHKHPLFAGRRFQ